MSICLDTCIFPPLHRCASRRGRLYFYFLPKGGAPGVAGNHPWDRGRASPEIADALHSDVSRFQCEQERFDDETIIVLKVP